MGLLGVAQGILSLCRSLDFAVLCYEFHIYGQGAEREEIAAFLEKEGYKRGIILHQSLSREEVPSILSSFDLTIIPLIKPIRGAVPSKIYEAMAAGLPIIFAGGGEGANLVSKHGAGWICTPADYTEMTEILKQISKLPEEELKIIRTRSRTAAELFFDRKIQVENLQIFLKTHLH
jgi:glycosyltransferase involved in cell wall biosynthesis